MSYIPEVEEMLVEEAESRMDRLASCKNLQKIILRANHPLSKDTILALKGTKALMVDTMCNTDNEYENRQSWGEIVASAHGNKQCSEVTTWSSLIRSVIEILKPTLKYAFSIAPISDEVIVTFKACVSNVCERTGIKLNSNCPKRLFKESEELELINSAVYLNNKNHMIKIFEDEDGVSWYLCAVYTDEIIVMIEALLDTIYSLMEEYSNYQDRMKDFPHHTIVISYVNRDDKEESINNIESVNTEETITVNRVEFIKDFIELEMRVFTLSRDINKLEEKYGIKSKEVDDIMWGNHFSK